MRFRWILVAPIVLSACSAANDEDSDSVLATAILSEELRIDGNAEELVSIRKVLFSSEHDIVLMQAQDGQVRYYDSDGEFVGAFGAQGSGPGEFSDLYNIGFVSDTLWMWDLGLSRMTLVSPNRELVRTFGVTWSLNDLPPDLTGVFIGGPLFVQGYRPDGDLIVDVARPASSPFPEPYVDNVVFGSMGVNGQVKGVPFHVRHGGRMSIPTNIGSLRVPFLLRNPARVALSDDGSRFASAVAHLDADQSEEIEVTMWSDNGEMTWSRAIAFDPVPLPSSVVDSVFVDAQQSLTVEGADLLRSELAIPDVYPPLAGVTIGMDGSVWVGMIERDGGTPYLVLNDEGGLVGAVSLPLRSQVAAADRDRVWVIERDELDVEDLVQYAIEWK
jgi:hypothetical protein